MYDPTIGGCRLYYSEIGTKLLFILGLGDVIPIMLELVINFLITRLGESITSLNVIVVTLPPILERHSILQVYA